VERSQHLTQADRRIFGRSYVAQTSSVDGQSAFLGKPADHSVNEFFQGLEMLLEEGAPTSLPKAMRADLERDPAAAALKAREEAAQAAQDAREADAAKKDRLRLLNRLERKAFTTYQKEWIKKRRAEKVLSRGRVSSAVDTEVSRLCLLIPERARIAAMTEQNSPLPLDKVREALRDLVALCKRDYTVFFLPGEEPLNGRCPVCDQEMQR
jgi:hypothetical protein